METRLYASTRLPSSVARKPIVLTLHGSGSAGRFEDLQVLAKTPRLAGALLRLQAWLDAHLPGMVERLGQKEIKRITNPDLPPGKMTVPEGSDPSHGMAVTADGKTLVVCSRLNSALFPTFGAPSSAMRSRSPGPLPASPARRGAWRGNPRRARAPGRAGSRR